MNTDKQEEASEYLAEKPPLNPVNSSIAPLEGDASKECNMHLLANAVDRVMYSPPSSANAESVPDMSTDSDQQHGTTAPLSQSSSAVLAPYKDNSLPTTSNAMNVAAGLIPAQDYSSSVQPQGCPPMPSSNYLSPGSSSTIPAAGSVSSMHATSSSMQQHAVNTVNPNSMPLPSHIVHSASSPGYVSGTSTESPSSSQHSVDSSASSVYSLPASTIHRPTNSMPGISTMLQPTSSGLGKQSSVWPNTDSSAGTVPPDVSSIPLPASDPSYNALSSLQSNEMMSSSSSSSPQLQMASSSMTFEHKPNNASPSMLGVSSSFEGQPNIIEDASQSNVSSVSTSKKANLCSSDSSSHIITQASSVPHLNNSNGPTSSVPTINRLHSTTGSQGYSKSSIYSQPSSTMPSQGEAATSCTSSLPESGQSSSAPNNHQLSQSDTPSRPSSSEFSRIQVASSSLGNLGLPSSSIVAADLSDAVSGSTDSTRSDSLLGSSKDVTGERATPASSSDASLQKVISTSVEKGISGSNDKVTSASGDKVTSASGNRVNNENNNGESGIITSGQSCVTSADKKDSTKVDNNVTSGRNGQSGSENSASDDVTSGTNNINLGQACVSSGTSGNMTSGTNNVSSGSEISNASSSKSRLDNSVADCSNSPLESSHSTQTIDSDRSNVSSSLTKSDQDSQNPSGSGHYQSVRNSLHGKEMVKEKDKHFSEENAKSTMKADSSSSSLKTKPVGQTSVPKEENSCSSTIGDVDTNCTNSKRPDVSGSKTNSMVSDSTSSTNLKDDDESSEAKVTSKETSGNSPSHLADSAEDQVEARVNEKDSPEMEYADTSTNTTDMGPEEEEEESGSPSSGLKRKRSQSPVSSSLAEPRRSRRQSKSKFNVLDVVGSCINIDYSLEDDRPPRDSMKSPTIVMDSPLTTLAREELMMDLGDSEMDDSLNNSYDSNNKSRFKEKIDMDLIIAPFEEGWRREVVIRGVYEEFTKAGKPKRVPADVYYYAPNKRKLRSMVQIVNHLREINSSLTSENFNFMRRSIYKPPFEHVRQAGSRGLNNKVQPSPKRPKGTSKSIMYGEGGDNPNIEPEFELALAATALTVVPSRTVKSEPVVKMEIEDLSNEELSGQTIGTQTPGKRPLEISISSEKKPKKTKSVARKSTCQLPKSMSLADVISKAEPFQPCSLSCPGLIGIPPTLHCDICMCLFHIACVNLKDNEVPKVFTCKNCMKDERLVRHKLMVNTTTTTTTTATATTTIPSAIIATTTTSSSNANKAILSVASIISPSSNIVNTITDSTASECEKKAKKVASKSSVITSSFKESSVTIVNVAMPRKHTNGTRQVVVLNGSTGTENSPIQIPDGNNPKTAGVAQLIPDSSDHVISTQNSVRTSGNPKANKNANSSPLIVRRSSPPLTPILPKDSVSVTAFNPTTTTTAASITTTTTVTTPSSTCTSNIAEMTTITSANATTSANSYSIDCTDDLNLKSSESPMIVSPSKIAAPSHTSPSATTSGSIKMEMLSSSSSSSSSTTHAHSGSGVNSVVGLQVSNTLLGSESYPRSGQLLTLPSAVAKRLNPSLPLALRINNMQLLIPPSRCINTAEGLKVFLPPKTFSVPSGSTTTMNITFSSGSMSADNAKDLSLSMVGKDKSMSLDMCDQVVDLSKSAETTTSKPVLKVTERRNKMKNYLCPFKTLYSGYDTMIQIFSYLSAGDLVRCSLVCRSWRRLATQSCLWNAIHLENTRISDWARATQRFRHYSVEELSLRGMQYEDDWNRVWHQLTPVLEQLTTLKRLYFDHVPALMLYTVCQKLPQLEDLGANMISDFTNEQQWTTPTKIDLAKFCTLRQLRRLQLRGTGGLASSISSGISEMVNLKSLQQLSLTTMKDVGDHDLDYLGELKQLKMLEMGDCTNWTSETYFQLGKLVNLEKLRLEHGGEIPDVGLADALSNLKSLQQLELITFVVADTLHLALSPLKNLTKLVIWPDTTHQAALINSNTFVTVIKLPTLKQLEWGVVRNKYSSIIMNESRSGTASSNSLGSDKDHGDMGLIPFLSPDAQALASQVPNNTQMLTSSSGNFTEYIGMRQLSEKLKCLLTHTQVSVFRTLDEASCVSSW